MSIESMTCYRIDNMQLNRYMVLIPWG